MPWNVDPEYYLFGDTRLLVRKVFEHADSRTRSAPLRASSTMGWAWRSRTKSQGEGQARPCQRTLATIPESSNLSSP